MTSALMSAIDVARRSQRSQLRAVDYLRVSTEEQMDGYGIEYTGGATKRFIAHKGWAHVGTFKDEGVPGSLPWQERDDARRLMELVQQEPRPFDVVVVYETRAIGRQDRAFWMWVWSLKDRGVFVAIVDKNIDNTTEQGEADMRDEANYAFKEYTRIRQRTNGGKNQKAFTGGYVGGRPPFGWRIEDKGVTRASRLALDNGKGGEWHTLAKGRSLIVEKRGDVEAAAVALNTAGLFTRSGVPWSRENLLARMTSDAVLKAQIRFRDPSKSRRIKTDGDGQPLYGETIVIPIPPAFTPQEVEELQAALRLGKMARFTKTDTRAPKTADRAYPLTQRLISVCGSHYVGVSHGNEPRRYGCTGKKPAYPGGPVCDCREVDAEEIERPIWAKVLQLLRDPEELRERAEEWAGLTADQHVDFAERIEELDRQIDVQDRAISGITAATAVQAAEQGNDVAAAIATATAPLAKQRAALVAQRDDARAWQAEVEGARQRSEELVRLADMARLRLTEATLTDKARLFAMLSFRVTMLEPVPDRPRGGECPVTEWFRAAGRDIPVPSEEAWAKVSDVIGARQRTSKNLSFRDVLQVLFLKAGFGGIRWAHLPPELGNYHTIQSRWSRWRASGLWEEIMDVLIHEDTVPLPEAKPRLPKLRLEGEIIPGLITGHSFAPDDTLPSRIVISVPAQSTTRDARRE
ncbi:recombinase family protein [Streptomyces chartreusis]